MCCYNNQFYEFDNHYQYSLIFWWGSVASFHRLSWRAWYMLFAHAWNQPKISGVAEVATYAKTSGLAEVATYAESAQDFWG